MTINQYNEIKTGLMPLAKVVYLSKLMSHKKLSLSQANAQLTLMTIAEMQGELPMPDNFDTLYKRVEQLTKLN